MESLNNMHKRALLAGMAFCLLSLTAHAQTDPRLAAALESKPAQMQQWPAASTGEMTAEECIPRPFGQALFDAAPEKSRNIPMSSKQRVMPGDRISLATWGAVETDDTAVVDSQGFIYVKGVGPVHVAGKTEESLSNEIREQIGKSFKEDVKVYARLEQNAGLPVMVTGAVARPGQYFGGAEDSIVVWLQRAGGISPGQGGYRNVKVLRSGKALKTVDLYAFLRSGSIPSIAWSPGDVVVVDLAGAQVTASGAVKRCAAFEFSDPKTTGADLVSLAQPLPGTSHAVLEGFRDGAPVTQVFSLASFRGMPLRDGDKVRFYAAPQNERMTVEIEGPIQGNKLLALPVHTRLSAALDMIPVDPKISDTSAVFIRRKSVAKAQKEALDESLNRLLQAALTAPAQSDGEALIRAKEAELIEQFVARTRDVRPEGRVVVMEDGKLHDLPLEDGDIVVIPQKTNVVSIEGEVVLPRAVVARKDAKAPDYVTMAGGYTERALKTEFIVVHPNGDVARGAKPDITAGDRLLVLPRVDGKDMQTAKDIVQILYQVAVGAGVLIKL